jgi:ketosteroid isomerase-like protein
MQSNVKIHHLALVLVLVACNKSTPATADSATVASGSTAKGFDKAAARAEIMRVDSGWTRNFMSKNVDSLMQYYSPDAVSMGEGIKAVTGAPAIRAAYVEGVKVNMRNPRITYGGIDFSDDGSLAYDHGTFTVTVDGPKGKPIDASGGFLNVFRKIGGRWVMVAEMSNSNKPGA